MSENVRAALGALGILATVFCLVGAMFRDLDERSRRGMDFAVESMRQAREHRLEHERVAREIELLRTRLAACEAKQ